VTNPVDPVDHARTTRPHAGETVKNARNLPALVVVGVAVVLFVACLAAFATGHPQPAALLAGLSAVGLVLGLGWLGIEHRRVRRIEDRWYDEHPGEIRQPPNS